MLDRPGITRLEPVAAPPLPIARLVVGKPVDEVAALLPRVYNLCPAAQGCAARLALGLALDPRERDGLTREILREHALRLLVLWPARLGLPGRPVDMGALQDLRAALFGAGDAPETPDAFAAFLRSGQGAAPLLSAIAALFAPQEACCAALPVPEEGLWPGVAPCENSVAGRRQDDPILRAVEAHHGRGPLWRVTARLLDARACLAGVLPPPRVPAPGSAVVAAARGAYFLRAEVRDGTVAALERITPTDHMLAPNGILAQSLNSLPGSKRHLAQLVIDLMDPCSPVTVREVAPHA
ncbi:hydrogenase expression/formation protein HupK [Seohaeicola saemankumensis]|nr:hydrogenase expression/formation protein HupK [Seohaeicola saemankumensis]MCA0869533.1 hydrogenase expression/formation protein HupK [Seohaeicola saemankumensis]